jgi:signal transduction histidine kinase
MRAARRVSIPIALTVSIVAITIALTVGWQILVVREFEAFVEGFTPIHWVLVILGSIFFALIITVLILQAVWLVREIRSNQRQQTFMDAVTHELYTPLASLRLYLDTLRGRSLPEARRDEFLEIMGEDLDRLQRTIDQILSAARTDLKRVPREPVDIARLLADCADDARDRFDLPEKAISVEVPAGARVRGDAEQLRVAIRNLIDNAIRYAGGDVHVEIRVRSVSARKLELEVADRGVGIPASALDRVFQRFSRLPQEAVRTARGLGLGLYIVRNVARAHGGSVRAESEGEGKGSRFILTLPGNVDERTRPHR